MPLSVRFARAIGTERDVNINMTIREIANFKLAIKLPMTMLPVKFLESLARPRLHYMYVSGTAWQSF